MKKIILLLVAIFVMNVANAQISLITNPSPTDSGFVGYPIVYNGNLYFQYCNSNKKFQLAKYDSSIVSLIANPSSSDLGMIGQAVIYNNNLYFEYQSSNINYLAKYNGTTLSLIANASTTDYGISGTPFVFNNNLYFPYKNVSGKYQLAYSDGNTLSLINNPDTISSGCLWSPVIYNNNLFLNYRDSLNKSHLAFYNGTNLNVLPNLDTSHIGFGYNICVYNNNLYSYYTIDCYYEDPHTFCDNSLAKYDGNSITLVNNVDGVFGSIIFNNLLYLGFEYIGTLVGTEYRYTMLYNFDGNTFNYIEGSGFDNYGGAGYAGDPIIFNDSLYFNYYNGSNYILAKYNGQNVTYINNPTVITYEQGGQGNSIIYNNSLYFTYINTWSNNYLAKYDGSQISLIPNPYITDYGLKGNFIIYNNALYFQYLNSDNKYLLAKYIDYDAYPPVVFDVTSGGTYFSCSAGSTVKLSGSQTNVMYYLYKNNVLIDSLAGTANVLVFDSLTTGTYTIKAKNVVGITDMNGNAVISVGNIAPSAAITINGYSSVCTGMTNVSYSVPIIPNATSYIWRLPYGIIDTTLTNTISVNFDTTTIPTYISVRGHNCLSIGDSTYLNISVNQLPGTAGVISGLDSVCSGNWNSTIYKVSQTPNATSYIWTLPVNTWGDNSVSDSINIYNFGFANNQVYLIVKGKIVWGLATVLIKLLHQNQILM